MKKNSYQKMRIIIPGIIGGAVALGITSQNYFIPLSVIILGIITMYIFKTHSKEKYNDERTHKIGNYAARYTIAIFTLGALIIAIILMTIKTNEIMWAVGQTLSYTICAILLIYILFYKYFSRKM